MPRKPRQSARPAPASPALPPPGRKGPDSGNDLIERLSRLRDFYAADNQIGLMIDELVIDLQSGAPREKIRQDAVALLGQLDRHSSAFRLISQATAQLVGG